MDDIIHCSLRIHGVQAFWSFELLHDGDDKPYIELGTDKEGKPITYSLDVTQILADRAGRAGHYEYRQEIIVT